MSPLWRERVSVGLCPDRLVLPGRGAPRSMAVEPAGEPLWRAAVDALPAALAACPHRQPRSVRVVLSHHFVRYALLPWSAALGSEAAWLAYAQHRFAAVHGAQAAQWTLRIAPTAWRGARIACATETALLEALRARLGERKVRLASVQPHLMTAFNAARRDLPRPACWLVVAEAGRLALALIERGAWRALRSRRLGADWRDALPALLERESALLGLPQAPPALLASAIG